jgi:hypothetical protein
LRDDVKELFIKLSENLDTKEQLLLSLLENEKSASFLIKNRSDAEDEILKIYESQADLIDRVNVEDFYISRIKDELIGRYRIDFDKLSRRDYHSKDKEIKAYREKTENQEKIAGEILAVKKSNNILMENCRDDLKQQISELERIDKIQLIIPKDLQSC